MAASRRPGALTVVAVATALLAAPSAGAAPFTVGSTADTVDASPGNGVCEAPCTLRAAVQTANGLAGLDVITLPAGEVELASNGGDAGAHDASIGDLDLTDDVRITGAGQGATVIDGNLQHRIFEGASGVSVAIEQLTVKNGSAPADSAFGERIGAGIRIQGTGTVNDVTLTGNDATNNGHGGGIASDRDSGAAPVPTLTLNRVTATGNRAGLGAAVNERFGGTLTINDSTLRDNLAVQGTVTENGGGDVVVNRTVISGTREPAGPPINSLGAGAHETGGGSLTINDSVITDNEADAGGGVSASGGGPITITRSSIVGNRALGTAEGGGGIVNEASPFTITDSLIAGNTTGRTGGGIEHLTNDPITITNTTISGNQAASGGGAINTDAAVSQFVLNNVTLQGNSSTTGGGTIDALPAGDVRLRNTIVSGGCAGTIASQGTNLDQTGGCGLNAAGDLKGVDPLLEALAGNGGPTQTHALKAGSPAIDAGAGCAAADQRGVARPQGPRCDIGAFERVPPAAPQQPQTPATPAATTTPPAPPPAAPRPATPLPTPARRVTASQVFALPSGRRCVSRRRFRIRIRRPRGVTLVSATVTVNRRRATVVRGARLRSTVDLRGLPRGRFTVRITVLTSTGQRVTGSRKYRTCAPKRRTRRRSGPL